MTQAQIDALIRHQTYISRFGAGLANRVNALMDPKGLLALVLSKRQFRKKIQAFTKAERKAARKLISSEINQMARLELSFLAQMSSDFKDLKYTNAEMTSIIDRALNAPMAATNGTVQELYDSTFDRKEALATSLNSQGNLGLKETALINTEMAAAIAQFTRGMSVANRSLSYQVSNEMREDAYKKSQVVVGVVITAVLDGRTSEYCKNIDGTIFPEGVGPRPIFHPSCRTVGVPVLEGQTEEEISELLSFRPQIGPGENYQKGDAKKYRATRKNVENGKFKVTPAGSGKKSGEAYPNFLASQKNSPEGIQFLHDSIGVKKGNRFMKLIDDGMSPEKALREVSYDVKAKDLDIKGLKKRSGGGSGSAPPTAGVAASSLKTKPLKKKDKPKVETKKEPTKVDLLTGVSSIKVMNDLKKRYPEEYAAYADSVPFGKVSLLKIDKRVTGFESYLNEGKAPDYIPLKKKLKEKGGPSTIVAEKQLIDDPDVKLILDEGQFFDPKTAVAACGEGGECHWNTGLLFEADKVDNIVIGYSQNNQGWHQHTWGVKDGHVVETTAENLDSLSYYGYELTKEESEEFAEFLKEHPAGEGAVRTKDGGFRIKG